MAADPITGKAIDGILNYDISDDDDPFTEITRSRDDKTTLSPRAAKRKADDDDKENMGLGLDEEVKITKKRKPVAKLDEARLLTQPGIPKLRSLAQSGQLAKKLRLKGKGHEFTDAARLLNYYQLWLDNLYPRAKFADGLQLVEKVGHSKNMQRMRREWIDEGKPGFLREREARKVRDQEDARDYSVEPVQRATSEHANTIVNPSVEVARRSSLVDGLDDNDMFFPDANARETEDGPDDDELEALLAGEMSAPLSKPKAAPRDLDSEGEDDLDALLAEQESRRQTTSRISIAKVTPGTGDDSGAEEDDDLDALLAEQESRRQTVGSKKVVEGAQMTTEDTQGDDDVLFSSSPIQEANGPGHIKQV